LPPELAEALAAAVIDHNDATRKVPPPSQRRAGQSLPGLLAGYGVAPASG
jgi:hypothetical protein